MRHTPGVTYCADIHDALIEFGWEGRRRVRVADGLGIEADPAVIGPRLLILLDGRDRLSSRRPQPATR
ncbi:hypothetical protein [Streptomyces sp. B21-083]|uniref:hypothetical protein n=1 Tax=Streptomyces sp. B21-083 TaxID=3039410 RepID=UPI002FEECC67